MSQTSCVSPHHVNYLQTPPNVFLASHPFVIGPLLSLQCTQHSMLMHFWGWSIVTHFVIGISAIYPTHSELPCVPRRKSVNQESRDHVTISSVFLRIAMCQLQSYCHDILSKNSGSSILGKQQYVQLRSQLYIVQLRSQLLNFQVVVAIDCKDRLCDW